MDFGQVVFIYSRLILGTLAAFLAIMLWSKTKDIAWMLMVIGIIAAYIETVRSILNLLGMEYALKIGSVSLASILLPALSMTCFIAAFMVMVIRRY